MRTCSDLQTRAAIEQYIMDYTDFILCHGICPECREALLLKIPTQRSTAE